jgi:GMP synthase (glutamine-hydrolysing)
MKHILVVDPAVETPELDCFNHLSSLSKVHYSYHLPAIYGFETLTSVNQQIDGVIVLGSMASVHDRRPWQKPLEAWLGSIMDRSIPLFGICYGHQMIAAMFGGQVQFKFPDRQKMRGSREIFLNFSQMDIRGARHLIVTHNEIVTSLPKGFHIAATSKEVEIDGLQHESMPIFTLQGHPEATEHFLKVRGMLEIQNLQALQAGEAVIKSFLSLVENSKSSTR